MNPSTRVHIATIETSLPYLFMNLRESAAKGCRSFIRHVLKTFQERNYECFMSSSEAEEKYDQLDENLNRILTVTIKTGTYHMGLFDYMKERTKAYYDILFRIRTDKPDDTTDLPTQRARILIRDYEKISPLQIEIITRHIDDTNSPLFELILSGGFSDKQATAIDKALRIAETGTDYRYKAYTWSGLILPHLTSDRTVSALKGIIHTWQDLYKSRQCIDTELEHIISELPKDLVTEEQIKTSVALITASDTLDLKRFVSPDTPDCVYRELQKAVAAAGEDAEKQINTVIRKWDGFNRLLEGRCRQALMKIGFSKLRSDIIFDEWQSQRKLHPGTDGETLFLALSTDDLDDPEDA